jgi:hypothetical protein
VGSDEPVRCRLLRVLPTREGVVCSSTREAKLFWNRTGRLLHIRRQFLVRLFLLDLFCR